MQGKQNGATKLGDAQPAKVLERHVIIALQGCPSFFQISNQSSIPTREKAFSATATTNHTEKCSIFGLRLMPCF